MPTEDDQNFDLSARLLRLEEGLAFCQHESEQISAEVRVLGDKVQVLSRRVDLLDRRLGQAEAARSLDPLGGTPIDDGSGNGQSDQE